MTKAVRVVVLGAGGMLGSTLVPYLQSVGYQTLRLARRGEADAVADLTDAAQVSTALDGLRPDVIVNLAALTNVDDCEKNPKEAYRANVRVVEHLATWIRGRGHACHLVQLSTDQVYDGAGPHKEDSLAPSNYYGFSKLAGELAAANVFSTILRTNFFGPSQCAGKASLSDWLVDSLRRQEAMTVFVDVRFSPLTLRRLSEFIELAIARPAPGVFNLGSREGMSKADFAFALAEVLGLATASMRRGTSDLVNFAAYRPKDMCMDSSRFERVFGVELPSLKEEIQSLRVTYVLDAK